MPTFPPKDNENATGTNQGGTARSTDERKGDALRGSVSSDAKEDLRWSLWAIDETAKLYEHLAARNRDLHGYVGSVGVAASRGEIEEVQALDRMGCRLVEKLAHRVLAVG